MPGSPAAIARMSFGGATMSQIAREFLTRCFAAEETIALLLRRENPASTAQRVVCLERVLESRYQAWLSYENSTGANIYVAANPLRSGSRKRTKESIASVRHVYIDIDTDGDARLAVLLESDLVPTPTAILSTSPGKYQVLWRVDGFDFDRQEQALKMLAIAFGGDPACTDRNRVLRIPGFINRKYTPAYCVTVKYPDDSVWTPDDFRMEDAAAHAKLFGDPVASRKLSAKHSHSESDWAWVSDQLAHGKDAMKLTRELALRRSDKPNPLYYAQRTVDVASARLWLLEGIRTDDVITMLECRRRFEIPNAVCSARAREIAATAARMIARKKTA
jgi:RepB DNA-primase from phage plasmid